MLCTACSAIFNKEKAPWYWLQAHRGRSPQIPAYQHHPSPAYIEKAAEQGCHICAVIWKKLSHEQRRALQGTWSNSILHRTSQQVRRLWGPAVAHYSWSPVYWSESDDIGIQFQFGDFPFWKKIVFRLLPTTPLSSAPATYHGAKKSVHDANDGRTDILQVRTEDAYQPDAQLRPASPLTMWSPQAQHIVSDWFTSCTEKHRACQRTNHIHPTFHPTRILYIGQGQIRLDTNKEKRVGKRYATLTHRWPTVPNNMPQLSSQNLREMQQDISPAILSPTFRDVIEVTRQLGIDYIWIDSLCIIQSGGGFREDWQRESATMGDIYQNAFLNIQAGTTQSHSSAGLFRHRVKGVIEPYQVQVTRNFSYELRSTGVYFPPSQGTFSIIEEDFARDELLAAAINQRGWVLQERLLSGRIIHFGSEQIFWECHQVLACEMFPVGLPKNIPKAMARADTLVIGQEERTFTMANRMTTHSFPAGQFDTLGVHKDFLAWFYVVELYSSCSLTRESDKLIALSGVAKTFAEIDRPERATEVLKYLESLALPRVGVAPRRVDAPGFSSLYNEQNTDDYLAGIWGRELLACLLWHVLNGRQADGETPAVRVEGVYAPSWSWASMKGLLHASIYQNWGTVDGVPLVEIQDTSVDPVSSANVWGQVSSGEIRLSGKLIHERSISWPAGDTPRKISHHTSEYHASIIRRIRLNSASMASLRILRANVLMYIDDREEFARWRRKTDGTHNEIALLPLIGLYRRRSTWSTNRGYIDEIYEYHGLVLALNIKARHTQSMSLTRTASPGSFSIAAGLPNPLHHSDSQRSLSLAGTNSSDRIRLGQRRTHSLAATFSSSALVKTTSDTLDHQSSEEMTTTNKRTYRARRLGYFRVHDTEVFGNTLARDDDVNIVLI